MTHLTYSPYYLKKTKCYWIDWLLILIYFFSSSWFYLAIQYLDLYQPFYFYLAYPVQVSGNQLVTVPVPASMYQTVVANLHPSEGGTVQVCQITSYKSGRTERNRKQRKKRKGPWKTERGTKDTWEAKMKKLGGFIFFYSIDKFNWISEISCIIPTDKDFAWVWFFIWDFVVLFEPKKY